MCRESDKSKYHIVIFWEPAFAYSNTARSDDMAKYNNSGRTSKPKIHRYKQVQELLTSSDVKDAKQGKDDRRKLRKGIKEL